MTQYFARFPHVGILATSPQVFENNWWAVQDSNLRPPACKAGALTS
jgi:hypothetical protein